MSRHTIHNIYIADGFTDDCDEILFQCSKLTPLTYFKFCHVWKAMKFDSIYNWRASESEIAELSEEVLQIAKRYLVVDTGNVEESVTGLFIVYGLLSLQPFPRFAALRLTPADVPALRHLERIARSQRRPDVLYILGAVLQASQCHVAIREMGPDPSLLKYLDGSTGIDRTGMRPIGVFYRQTEELDILKEIDRLGKLYDKAKKNTLDKEELAKNLNYVDLNLANELTTSLKGVINGTFKQRTTEEKDAQARSSKMNEIKERALKNTVKSMRHLTPIAESPIISPIKKRRSNRKPVNDIISSPTKRSGGKVKASSPAKPKGGRRKARKTSKDDDEETCPTVRKNTRKRQRSPKKKVKRKRRGLRSSGNDKDSSSEEINVSDESDDDFKPKKTRTKNKIVTSKSNNDAEMELNVDDENNVEMQVNNEVTGDFVLPYDLNIEVDSLPILMKTEDENRLIEIEIIDNYNYNVNNQKSETAEKSTNDLVAKLSSLPDLSIEKANVDNRMAGTSKLSDDELFKIPAIIRKRSKCTNKSSKNHAMKRIGMVTTGQNLGRGKRKKK